MWPFNKINRLKEELEREKTKLYIYEQDQDYWKKEFLKAKAELASYNLLAEEKKRAAMLYLQREGEMASHARTGSGAIQNGYNPYGALQQVSNYMLSNSFR